jgi:adenine-specific DNA-methyltransferase
MPYIDWLGKKDVVHHHKSIPYKTIECREEIGDADTQNMIIKGDNLLALKSLLPYYASRVKMIYIDPPYNTGNTSWVYNDNMDTPLIKKWLEKTVNAEDLSRSDKWLCMMYPRLKLLRELLKEDGVIFISIDDAEVAHLRMICDDIFGGENFLANILWKKKTNGNNMGYIPPVHDHILVFSKNINCIDEKKLGLPMSEEYIKKNYSNPDNHNKGLWTTMDLSANHKGPNFEIINPMTGEKHFPSDGRYWVFNEEEVLKRIQDGRIIFGKNGNAKPVQRIFLQDRKEKKFKTETWWDKHGMNADGTSELKDIFGISKPFDHSKPSKLLLNIVAIATENDDIILD